MSRGQVEDVILDNAIRSGHVVRVHPCTFADADLLQRMGELGRHDLRCHAALRYVGDTAAVSHLTALAIWQLRRPIEGEPIHVLTTPKVRRRAQLGLVVHRQRRFDHILKVRRGGVVTVHAAHAIVQSWPLLAERARIGIVVAATEARLASVAQISKVLGRQTKLAARSELRRLLDLIGVGCRSPLEVWGAAKVFAGQGFAHLKRQAPVRIGTQVFYLDLFDEAKKVNFELDGATWHGGEVQRERDIRRDALLATAGILVVRFSYGRLMSEPDTVRREALAILAARN